MNKNLGKKFFTIMSLGLILIGISLFNLERNKVEIEDLYGKRSEMEDVSILLQSRKGMYETDQIKVNKNGLFKEQMVKQGMYNFKLSDRNIEAREVLESVSNGTAVYTDILLEYEDRTSAVYITNVYSSDEKYEFVANIIIKYKNSEKIERLEIPLGNVSSEYMDLFSSVPISIDKDNIYLSMLSSNFKGENVDDSYNENNYDSFDKTVLDLYKINLSTKKSKHILAKEFDGKDIYLTENLCFSNNNKSYFLVKEIDGENGYYKTSLLEFDVIERVINTINLGTKNDNINKFSIDDNKLILIYSEGSEYEKEDKSKSSALKSNEVRAILVNLENLKVEYLKHININTSASDVLQIRRLNNKIYLVTREYEEEGNYTGNYYYLINVIDEKNNELLYKGKIEQKSSYFVEVGILKSSEI